MSGQTDVGGLKCGRRRRRRSEQRNDILTAAVVPGKINLLRIHPLIEG